MGISGGSDMVLRCSVTLKDSEGGNIAFYSFAHVNQTALLSLSYRKT